MRFTHILVVFVALVVATACSYNDIDEVHSKPEHASQYLQVVGRVAQYSDCNVATRSKKEGDESKITSMGLALFPIENDTIGNCLYYDFELGGSIVFVVDRHDDVFKNYTDTLFAMYIFANMQDAEGFPLTSEAGVGKSLDFFTKCASAANANVEDVPANGFPMMGSMGNNTQDANGITLILKPTQTDANVDGLPLVNGSPTDNLEIPLKSMYAKFTFTISVKPDQEIVGNKAPRFDLISYKVNNIAATVDANSETNNDSVVIVSSGSIGMGTYAQGATTAKFDFYLPERYLTPDTLAEAYGYPLGTNSATVNGYSNIPDENKKYAQRFKNKLVGDKAATYVTITGKFTDHQGHVYDVDYNIYLGSDNYGNFDIIRNTHYNNSITIRGISVSDDQADNDEGISIDWRVDVTRTTPLVIGLRREALLDAHFEVRPLRLRLVGEDIPTGTSATVTILNENGTEIDIPNWIRLEASGSTSDHITTDGSSKGKRKYFTADLVTNTLAGGTSVTVNSLTRDNQTVWIYVDENTDTKSRAAIVRVSYAGVNTDYEIVQHGLFKVTGADSGRDYYIEQYEEYLYNYDTEDSYGQTKQEGMPWGLPNKQLSKEHRSFTNSRGNSTWDNYVNNNTLPTYDFYIEKHDGDFAAEAGATMVHSYAGQHFTEDIVKKSNNGVSNLTMDQQANGAVEYCYNRNKRNSDGSITKILWYLPSADELEDFIVPAYSSFEEFQDNYYWTSQPAYIRNVYYYEDGSNTFPFIVFDDNPEYARATKVVAKGNDTYEYALSGLNDEPDPYVDFSGYTDGKKEENFGYFYMMYRWKSGTDDETFGQDGFGGTANGKQYKGEEFNEKLNGSTTGIRYHVHLGHLYDMLQEGYHHRTQNNRVRCVRADLTTNNQQMVLVYTVSDTPATTLDTSGNTMYVMKNTNYSTYLTTSGTYVAASNADLSFDNYVVIEGNKIKSVARNQYFYGSYESVSFNNNGTDYTISNSNSGSNFTISAYYGYYYLKQTNNSSVKMMYYNDDGYNKWQFYEVKKEYKVVNNS